MTIHTSQSNRTHEPVNKHGRAGPTSKQVCKSYIIWGFEILQQPLTQPGVRWSKEVRPVAVTVSRTLCISLSPAQHRVSTGTWGRAFLGIHFQEENSAFLSHVITPEKLSALKQMRDNKYVNALKSWDLLEMCLSYSWFLNCLMRFSYFCPGTKSMISGHLQRTSWNYGRNEGTALKTTSLS